MKRLWRELPRLSRIASLVGAGGLLACTIGGIAHPAMFFQAWLVTWLFLLGIALAAMMDVMIHELTGGQWGGAVRPPLEAAMMTLPLLFLLAVPLSFGLPALFEWARPDAVVHSDILQAKRWYLNQPGFLVRNATWLLVWSGFAIALRRRLLGASDADLRGRRRLAVAGLLVYLVTITFAAYDWVASLVPEWSSTAVGLRLGAAQFVAAFGFAVPFAVFLPRDAATHRFSTRDSGDLGNLLLTFAMFWAYIAFTQYLIVWGEDLPVETGWFGPRVQTTWWGLGLAVGVLDFAIPVVAMLFRDVKRDARLLAIVCLLALAGQWLDSFWLTVPSLRAQGFEVHWLDVAALLGEGGLWLATVGALSIRMPDAVRITLSRKDVAHG